MNQRTPKQPKLGTQKQAAPRHPQAFLLAATQHHSGLIHVDENSCLVANGPSQFGPLQVRCCFKTSSNHWTKKANRNSKKCKFWGPFWGQFLDPKMGLRLAALLRILLKPNLGVHFWCLFWDPKLGPKIDQKTQKKRPKTREKNKQEGIQGFRKKRSAKSSQSSFEPTASLTLLLITCKKLLQPALVVRM